MKRYERHGMKGTDFRLREELADQMKALNEMKELAASYGFDLSVPAKNAKEAVEAQFEEQLKNGSLVFKTIDISKEENEAIADKYEVTWSSLFLVRYQSGKESAENLTKYAFANARTAPDTFKQGLTEKINGMLD